MGDKNPKNLNKNKKNKDKDKKNSPVPNTVTPRVVEEPAKGKKKKK
ncbi:MAG: hypothetical protein AAB116_21180 [Candidatus Poribacteria bacterium]